MDTLLSDKQGADHSNQIIKTINVLVVVPCYIIGLFKTDAVLSSSSSPLTKYETTCRLKGQTKVDAQRLLTAPVLSRSI